MKKLNWIYFGCWLIVSQSILSTSAHAVSEQLVEDANAAMAAQERGDNEAAIRLFSLVLSAPDLPKDERPKALASRGKAYYASGDNQLAIADFTEAIRLNSKLAEAYAYRGAASINIGQVDKALVDLNMAVRLKPDHWASRYYRGVAYLNKKQIQLAISDFDEAIKSDSKYAEAYYKRGIARAMTGNFKDAIANYSEAIERKPAYPYFYSDRGIAYLEIGDPEKAIADLDSAIHLGSNDEETRYRRGLALFKYKRTERGDEALNDFDESIRQQPDTHPDAYFMRGVLLSMQHKYERAIESYTKAIKLMPGNLGVYLNRGLAYQYQGDSELAIADFNTVIQRRPKLEEAYLYRGLSYAQKGRYDQSLRDFDEMFRLKLNDNQHLQMLRARATVLFASGKFEDAARDFDAALKISVYDDYATLWPYLARARMGQAGIDNLLRASSQDKDKWPAPLEMFYMGKMNVDELYVAGKITGNAEIQKRRECVLAFHAGEYGLMQHNANAAKQYFDKALTTCSPVSVEKLIAQAEIHRIEVSNHGN